MANQTRSAAIAALVTRISDNISAIGTIYNGSKSTAQMEDSAYPALCVVDAGTVDVDRSVTSTRYTTVAVHLWLYYKTTDTTDTVAQGIEDNLIKYVEAGAIGHLSNTVANITAMPERQVDMWGDTIRSRTRTVHLVLEQDFP
jgi:hypothetical protein